jgi:hypothetical protein
LEECEYSSCTSAAVRVAFIPAQSCPFRFARLFSPLALTIPPLQRGKEENEKQKEEKKKERQNASRPIAPT